MPDKFKKKYRISSARLQSWDYGNNGSYFITICTKNREHFFGEILETLDSNVFEMHLNETGKLAEQFWIEIPNHFPFIELGNFVVMPNHIHGILIIDKNANVIDHIANVESVAHVETLHCNVSTANDNATNKSINSEKNEKMSKISPKSGSISTIIRSYKSVVTKNVNAMRVETLHATSLHATSLPFAWQSRFHDHIIRNAESFERIQNYIATNPQNWKDDKFHS